MGSILENFGDFAPRVLKSGCGSNTHGSVAGSVPQEPYVDAQRVARHLSLTRREVLKLTRAKKLPAHAIDPNAARKTYRYKLSEIDDALSLRLVTEQALGLCSPSQDNDHRQSRDQRGLIDGQREW